MAAAKKGVMVVLVLLLCSCGSLDFFSIKTKSKSRVESKPAESFEHEELRKGAVGFVADVTEKVVYEGAEPGAPIVVQAKEAVAVVESDIGPPGERWPIPPPGSDEAQPEVTGKVVDYREVVGKHAKAVWQWEEKIEEAARKPEERSLRIGSPFISKLLTWKVLAGSLGGLSGILIAVTGLYRKKVQVGVAALSTVGGMLQQVVNGVQKHLDKTSPKEKKALKASLSKATDKTTKAEVYKLRKSV